MKIWIDEVGDGASAQVRFSSAGGHATAVWRGRARPRAGEQDEKVAGRMLELDSPVLELYPTGI